MLHTALATAAALVSLAFAFSTFERWLERRRRQELAWTLALAFFSLAAFALAAGAALGWTPLAFRLFYLFGAIVNVPFLATGTVYLLGGRRAGDVSLAVTALVAAFATGVVLFAPLTGEIPSDRLVQGREVFGPAPRILAAACSGAGALVVFAGAAWSAWRRRGATLWANVLIAAGTLLLSGSGLLNSVLDEMDAFAVTLAAGITVIFAGFLLATASPTQRRDATTPTAAAPAGRASRAARGAAASRPARAAAREPT